MIDEVQMVRDPTRGWAWTRAVLGVAAQEVHVCGEAAAISLLTQLAEAAGEEIEVGISDMFHDIITELPRLSNCSTYPAFGVSGHPHTCMATLVYTSYICTQAYLRKYACLV